jgi:hypothetical protein
LIGTDKNGVTALSNGLGGVLIEGGASYTVVGGTASNARNVISGNGGPGIWIADIGSDNTIIQGNLIGLAADGGTPLGNSTAGVLVNHGLNALIGGPTAGARNVISGNSIGIFLSTSGSNFETVIQGNYIGTDITGTLPRGNQLGVGIGSAPGTRLLDNVVSGNAIGVRVFAISHPVIDGKYNSVIQGNRVGLNAAGTGAVANATGILIDNAHNLIGGAHPASRNVVAGNSGAGIVISGSAAIGNQVLGNQIGGGTVALLGNGSHGILISSAASNNAIGSTATGAGNTITFSGGDGIRLTADAGTGNAILSNSIDANTGLGIDLGGNGVTVNDLLDRDTGANQLQNTPILTGAGSDGTSITIKGKLDSLPRTVYGIQVFRTPACDPSRSGEGKLFLGSVEISTNGGGSGSINVTFGSSVAGTEFITATATDPMNNTSEFSNCQAVAKEGKTKSVTADRIITMQRASSKQDSQLADNQKRSPAPISRHARKLDSKSVDRVIATLIYDSRTDRPRKAASRHRLLSSLLLDSVSGSTITADRIG